jgi:hypothetical protein
MNDSVFSEQLHIASEQEFPRVKRKLRYKANLRAREWVEENGSKYNTKQEAIEAFKSEVFQEQTGLQCGACCASESEVKAFGFPILATVLAVLLSWLVGRWLDRLFPEK